MYPAQCIAMGVTDSSIIDSSATSERVRCGGTYKSRRASSLGSLLHPALFSTQLSSLPGSLLYCTKYPTNPPQQEGLPRRFRYLFCKVRKKKIQLRLMAVDAFRLTSQSTSHPLVSLVHHTLLPTTHWIESTENHRHPPSQTVKSLCGLKGRSTGSLS